MADDAEETFKSSRLRGWIRSSTGDAIRIGSRTGIDDEDELGSLHIDSETMSAGPEVVVDSGSIPDLPERPRARVLDRLQRAFDAQGVTLTAEDAWFG